MSAIRCPLLQKLRSSAQPRIVNTTRRNRPGNLRSSSSNHCGLTSHRTNFCNRLRSASRGSRQAASPHRPRLPTALACRRLWRARSFGGSRGGGPGRTAGEALERGGWRGKRRQQGAGPRGRGRKGGAGPWERGWELGAGLRRTRPAAGGQTCCIGSMALQTISPDLRLAPGRPRRDQPRACRREYSEGGPYSRCLRVAPAARPPPGPGSTSCGSPARSWPWPAPGR
jgi:hypothetical protein